MHDSHRVSPPPLETWVHAFSFLSAVVQKQMATMAAADGHVTRSEWVRGIVMMAVSALRQPIMALVPFMAFTHIVKVLSLATEIALTVDSAALSSIVGSASARKLSPALVVRDHEVCPVASATARIQPCGQQFWGSFCGLPVAQNSRPAQPSLQVSCWLINYPSCWLPLWAVLILNVGSTVAVVCLPAVSIIAHGIGSLPSPQHMQTWPCYVLMS